MKRALGVGASGLMNTESRTNLLRRLVCYEQPIEPVLDQLRKHGWDCETPVFCVLNEHLVNILNRYLDDELDAAGLQDWAECLEEREDIGFEEGCETLFRAIIFELGNPEINHGITHKLVESLKLRLGASD